MAQTNKKTHKRVEYLYSRPSKIIIVVSYLSQCWWDTYTLLKSWKLSPPSNFFKYKVENSKEIKVVELKNSYFQRKLLWLWYVVKFLRYWLRTPNKGFFTWNTYFLLFLRTQSVVLGAHALSCTEQYNANKIC